MKGDIGAAVEYHGPGVEPISYTDMMTVYSMGKEIGGGGFSTPLQAQNEEIPE